MNTGTNEGYSFFPRMGLDSLVLLSLVSFSASDGDSW